MSGCYELRVRPRFVVMLCVACWLAASAEMLDAISGAPSAAFRGALLGLRVGGELGRVVRIVEGCALCIGAWGLWKLRRWARGAAMAYLGAMILSFLFLGVGTDSDRATWTLVWQITIVPFATFSYMFLHNGRRHFEAGTPAPPVQGT